MLYLYCIILCSILNEIILEIMKERLRLGQLKELLGL